MSSSFVRTTTNLPCEEQFNLESSNCLQRRTPAKRHGAELAAEPSTRHRGGNESERIPVGPEGRSSVPGNSRTYDAREKSESASNQGVEHWPTRSESRRDVAASDAINEAIGGCKPKE